MDKSRKEFIDRLDQIQAFKFGDFILKSAQQSPLYVDLRLCISFPKLIESIAKAFAKKVQGLSFDAICGVPYAALAFATALSLELKKPLLMRRKEKKAYGRKRKIEGLYEKGQKVLIVEDLITSGSSAIDTAQDLENEGLVVKDFLVVLDRCQGGKEIVQQRGYQLHALLEMQEVLSYLLAKGRLDPDIYDRVCSFLIEKRGQAIAL